MVSPPLGVVSLTFASASWFAHQRIASPTRRGGRAEDKTTRCALAGKYIQFRTCPRSGTIASNVHKSAQSADPRASPDAPALRTPSTHHGQ